MTDSNVLSSEREREMERRQCRLWHTMTVVMECGVGGKEKKVEDSEIKPKINYLILMVVLGYIACLPFFRPSFFSLYSWS